MAKEKGEEGEGEEEGERWIREEEGEWRGEKGEGGHVCY